MSTVHGDHCVTARMLEAANEGHKRKRERLIRHVSDLEGTVRRRGAALEDLREKLADAERRAELAEWTQDKIAGEANDLREEIDRLERIIQAPLSLRDMEVAWEAAEVPTDDAPIRAGDVMIFPTSRGHVIRESGVDRRGWRSDTRVLSRAPREPWADLADVLGDFAIRDKDGDEYPDMLARMLHERGVRVTGGDDDE